MATKPEAIGKDGGEPAPIATPRALGEDFVRADPQVVALLAQSDVPTWERLLDPLTPLGPSDACPRALLDALLAIDTAEGWERRCDLAFGGRASWDGGSGSATHFVFRPWLARGVLEHVSPADRSTKALSLRYRALSTEVTLDATRLARDLTSAAEDTPLLGNALLLLALRLREDGDDEGAADAAARAEDLFARAGDETSRVRAVRMCGAARMRQRRLDEAIALLDTVRDAPYVIAPEFRSHTVRPRSDDVFSAAAAEAERGTDTRSWFDALAKVARAVGDRGLADRAESGLRGVAEREAASARDAERRRAAEEAAATREAAERATRAAIRRDEPRPSRIWDSVEGKDGSRTWQWAVIDAFDPVYDATASADGVLYCCEIRGPFCGYDRVGSQSWEEFSIDGPLPAVHMPASVASEIRAFGLALRKE